MRLPWYCYYSSCYIATLRICYDCCDHQGNCCRRSTPTANKGATRPATAVSPSNHDTGEASRDGGVCVGRSVGLFVESIQRRQLLCWTSLNLIGIHAFIAFLRPPCNLPACPRVLYMCSSASVGSSSRPLHLQRLSSFFQTTICQR